MRMIIIMRRNTFQMTIISCVTKCGAHLDSTEEAMDMASTILEVA